MVLHVDFDRFLFLDGNLFSICTLFFLLTKSLRDVPMINCFRINVLSYHKADDLRERLMKMNILLKDSPWGTIWQIEE